MVPLGPHDTITSGAERRVAQSRQEMRGLARHTHVMFLDTSSEKMVLDGRSGRHARKYDLDHSFADPKGIVRSLIQSSWARRNRTERANGATRAGTTRDKVYFIQHSHHNERRGIGRKHQTPSAQTTRRVPDLGALALRHLSNS